MRLSREMLKKSWFHIALLVFFGVAIALLMLLDYFNLEKIAFFSNAGFLFDYTWKGRLFLLFFIWLFFLESFLNLDWLKKENLNIGHRSRLKIAVILVFAAIPLIYIIAINFLGLDQVVLGVGEFLRGDYWRTVVGANWANSLQGDWPMSLEYVVFTVSFLVAILLAYGKKGLSMFALTAALVAGIAVVYMIDTMFPYGNFMPFQAFALPTAACAAVLLQALGIPFTMSYSSGYSAPIISVTANGISTPTSVAWPCAGVHSLFLYTIIVLLLFRKSDISGARKSIYFIVGAAGTYFMNILRIVSYFVILINQGQEPALIFHNVYGEFYFFTFILLYIILIVAIQKYKVVEKIRTVLFKKKLMSIPQAS